MPLPTRAEAQQLLEHHVKDPYQRYHAQMVATAMEGARAVSAGERWNRELEQIYVELLRAHAAVPGADPDIAARARGALEARRAGRAPPVA